MLLPFDTLGRAVVSVAERDSPRLGPGGIESQGRQLITSPAEEELG